MEETGLICEPKDLFLMREMQQSLFGHPDIYFAFILNPLTQEMNVCQNEIQEYRWVNIDNLQEFIDKENVAMPLQKYILERIVQLNAQKF